MFRRILRRATNTDGQLLFEFIDGRAVTVDYKAFLNGYREITRIADQQLELEPKKRHYEKELARLLKYYANQPMHDEVTEAFKKQDGSHSAILRDWEYYFIINN